MPTLKELEALCNALYPPLPDAQWNGLQYAGSARIERVATAVSADLATIEAAEAAGCQALITHHGLFWKGADPRLCGPLGARVAALQRSGISLLSYHLPMDLHPEQGNNWPAARALGMHDLRPLGPELPDRLAVLGTLPPIEPAALLLAVAEFYGVEPRVAPGGSIPITQAVVLSGAGHKVLPQVAALGAQALITGCVDEPQWGWARESGCWLFAVGHAASERIGPRALATWLQREGQVEALFLMDDNPF